MSQSQPPALPRRASRATEAAEFLRQRILSGVWPRLLPGEMDLASQLQVGRNTLRAALAQLESEGLIKTQMGRRREVTVHLHEAHPTAQQTALLLLGTPYHALAISTLLWIDTLRSYLSGVGWHLHVRVESTAFRRHPEAVLETLVMDHPGAVWILHRSTSVMQEWFQKQGLQTVIAGTQHAGISLPQVDTDYRAVSRHAASRLIGLGHRQLLILAARQQLAGDTESIAGFREALGDQAQVEITAHNETPAGVISCLRQALEQKPQTTGIFVLRADHFATALTWLLQQGYQVPNQISLISRDEEPFLQHLCPEPTRYQRSAETFAKKLARLVTTCGESTRRQSTTLLMPDFIRGGTLSTAQRR